MNPQRRKFATRLMLLLAAAVVVYLAGNATVSLWDRDEPRYAQTSRQMLQSGDWVVPMLLDEPREKKPVFIYWCQAASMAVLRDTVFAARLPSVIGITATLLVLAAVLWKAIGPRRALWTAFIFATSALTIAAAKMCITDGVLLLFVTISQLCLYGLLHGRATWFTTVTAGLAIGFGLLTKGPVVPAVMLMTWIVLTLLKRFDRRPAIHPPSVVVRPSFPKILTLIVLAAAVYCLWGIPIERRLPGYHVRTIKAEVLDRAAKPQEGHKGPPGFYLLTIWGTYLPWSLLLPAVAIAAWRRRHLPHVRFAIAAVIGPWILFELIQTKLVHYVLPVFPPLAFLTADRVVRSNRLRRLGAVLGVAMLALVAIVYGFVLPHVDALRVSNRLAAILIREGATGRGDAIMIDYKETSLAFYQGGTIRPQSNNQYLVQTPPRDWPRWIVMTDAIWRRMPEDVREKLEIVDSVQGLNYAGKDADRKHLVNVHVLRKR